MLFNSFVFAVFLPIVFCLYWLLRPVGLRWQNGVLLVASYIFYGWWDYRFLVLLFITSATDFLVGVRMDKTESDTARRWWLCFSLAANLTVLGFFKYYDFFAGSLAHITGWDMHFLKVVLPVGISFYTFQSMSYTIEVYRRHIPATHDFLAFMTFVSFFPQLVAGPIGRGHQLLLQFFEQTSFDFGKARDGLRQALWGLFKKVIIADNLSSAVDRIFSNYASLTGSELLLGAIFFGIQIYCDFSGYTDIAIGIARLFGVSLMRNFDCPYFSSNIQDFWRRWHISLTSWFRDYVYISLGGNRAGRARSLLNIMIVFFLSGLWHGANWTFVIWGLLHALLYISYLVLFHKESTKGSDSTPNRYMVLPGRIAAVAVNFLVVNLLWVFFRAKSLGHAIGYFKSMILNPWHLQALIPHVGMILACICLMGVEWCHRNRAHGLDISYMPLPARWVIYYALIGMMVWWGNTLYVPFIYFAF